MLLLAVSSFVLLLEVRRRLEIFFFGRGGPEYLEFLLGRLAGRIKDVFLSHGKHEDILTPHVRVDIHCPFLVLLRDISRGVRSRGGHVGSVWLVAYTEVCLEIF